MTRVQLISEIKKKKSFLCVGLDTDLDRIPEFLLEYEDPIFEFNKRIIEATEDLCVAYKPNIAFYECYGASGWTTLSKTLKIIPEHCFTIADAKRGDIGNTAKRYADAFFTETSGGLNFDALTVAPYMGKDSITPFLEYSGKWAIVLGLTSNSGSVDFQRLEEKATGKYLYEQVLYKTSSWGTPENLMFVVGATQAKAFEQIRKIVPDHFLLVPGIGAQGGDFESVCQFGMNADCGLLVNATRSIIYASSSRDFAEKARSEAARLQQLMETSLERAGILS